MYISNTENGFQIHDNVLTSNECEEILAAIPQSETRAGIRHLMSNDEVRAVALDERLMTVARLFAGDTAIPYRATLFNKSGIANWLVTWHQDTALPLTAFFDSPDWESWSVKEGINYAHAPAAVLERIIALRIHLDDSNELNGPLRVVPGSHLLGVLNDDAVLRYAREHEHVECFLDKGGVLAMRPLLIHASSKVRQDYARRVLHIEYIDSLDISGDIKIAIG